MSFKLVKIIRTRTEVMKMYTKEQMMGKVIKYFEKIQEEAEANSRMTRPSISGLALFLGFPNKKYMLEMIPTEYGDIVEYGIAMIEQRHEEQLFNPHIAGSKFWLSTIGKWSEKQEEEDKVVNVSINGTDIKVADVEEIDIDELELEERLKEAGLQLGENEEGIND